jgi:hypothetical protein
MRLSDNPDGRIGGIAMHPVGADNRYQIGDPGRYLLPGLFQQLIATLDENGIDPADGYTVELVDAASGAQGRITGTLSALKGVHHPDEGTRDLGEFLTETGHLAFADISICTQPDACDQCLWISVDEPVVAVARPGLLLVRGKVEHLRIRTVAAQTKAMPLRKAA